MYLEQAGIHLRRGNDTAARSAIACAMAALDGDRYPSAADAHQAIEGTDTLTALTAIARDAAILGGQLLLQTR